MRKLFVRTISPEFQLFYKDLAAGKVTGAFASEGTIYGIFHPLVAPEQGRDPAAHLGFRRVLYRTGTSGPKGSRLHQRQSSMHIPILYARVSGNGLKRMVLDAPVFFMGDEITLDLADTAANSK